MASKNSPPFSQSAFFFIIFIATIPWFVHGLNWPSVVIRFLGHCPEIFCDFSRHYYPQAQSIHLGNSGAVVGWYYPPTLAMLIMPLGGLSLNSAVGWWLGFSTLVTFGMVAVCAQSIPRDDFPPWKRWLLSLAVVLSSFPVLSSLKWGQISLLLVLLMLLALRKINGMSGLLLGFAASLKAYPLFYALFPLLHKKIRPFLLMLLFFGLIGILWPLLLLGFSETALYFQAMFSGGQGLQQVAPVWGGQALVPSMHRWFISGQHMIQTDTTPLLLSLPPSVNAILTLLVFGFLSIFSLSSIHRSRDLKGLAVFLCWIGLMIPPGWHHYFCFLPFCQLVIWSGDRRFMVRALLVIAFLLERIPVLLLGVEASVYYVYSAAGGTCIVTLLTLSAGLWGSNFKGFIELIRSFSSFKMNDEDPPVRTLQSQ